MQGSQATDALDHHSKAVAGLQRADPLGVPVMITSPGSRVMQPEMKAISSATGKIWPECMSGLDQAAVQVSFDA